MIKIVYMLGSGEICATVPSNELGPLPDGVASIDAPSDFDLEASSDWRVVDGSLVPSIIPPHYVDQEMARRVKLGVMHRGYVFQLDPVSQGNITAMSLRADRGMRDPLIGPLSLRWSRPDHDAHWISADNSRVPMTAQQMIEFGEAAANHIEALRFAARNLKDSDPIPADYAADFHWP